MSDQLWIPTLRGVRVPEQASHDVSEEHDDEENVTKLDREVHEILLLCLTSKMGDGHWGCPFEDSLALDRRVGGD
ncbi:MAG: hypothetical protein KBA71_11650 [Opitutaceae bacterium]|nr:hypothetical protein [Opitutaceae bacterium]